MTDNIMMRLGQDCQSDRRGSAPWSSGRLTEPEQIESRKRAGPLEAARLEEFR